MVLGLNQRQVMAVALPLVLALLMAGWHSQEPASQPDDSSELFDEFLGDSALELLQKKATKVESKPSPKLGEQAKVIEIASKPSTKVTQGPPPPPKCMEGCDGDICAISADPERCHGTTCKCGTMCSPMETQEIQYVCSSLPTMDKPPPCAATCPNVAPTCEMVKSWMKDGGCAASCSADIRSQGLQAACAKDSPEMGPPPCAKSCPQTEQPTCDHVKNWMKDGGCAATCSADIKRQAMSAACHQDVPKCAQSCPKADIDNPTCDNVKKWMKDGGCAGSCSEDIKKQAMKQACKAL